jgi:DNA-binding transcriptional ArsR family regulator
LPGISLASLSRIDKYYCPLETAWVLDLEVIDDPSAAQVALDPVRAGILATLVEPGSATTVAASLGLARQKVNYHLRLLEEHGLVGLVEERPRRGLTERVVQASAKSYLVSPAALGTLAPQPQTVDRLSSQYLLAIAGRVVREVSSLVRAADKAGKPLATLAIDTDIRFASAADRAAFTNELANSVTALVSKYHNTRSAGGRWHRVMIAAHPKPAP